MLKYSVECDDSLDRLIEAVNEKIKKGWQLVGGIATMTHPPRYTVFYQAMTIEKQPQKPAKK